MTNGSITMKITITFCAGMLFLFSCSPEPADKRDRMQHRMENIQRDVDGTDLRDRERFENDRQEILNELHDLLADINADISDTENKLTENDPGAEEYARNATLRAELLRQRSVVERHIAMVETAGMNGWEEMRVEMRNSMDEAQLFYDREGMQRRSARAPADPILDLNRNAEEVR